MFCSKCGAKNADDALFCGECGTTQDSQQLKTQPLYQPAVMEQRTQTLPGPSGSIPNQARPAGRPPQKHPMRRIIILVCICLVVVLGGIGFIVNALFARDILQTVYGSDRYAKMSEKTAAQVVGNSMVSTFNDLYKTSAVQKKDQAFMQQQKFDVSLDNNLKNYYANSTQQTQGKDFLGQLTNYINLLTFQTTYNYNGGLTHMGLAVSDGSGKLLSAAGYLDSGHNGYYQLPEISSTYFLMKDITLNPNLGATLRNFSFDQKQMSASIGKLTNIWNKAIDGGKASIENDSELSVEGVSVKAEKVTVTLDGNQLANLSENLINAIRDDEYLYTFLNENDKSLLGSGQTTLLSYLRINNVLSNYLAQPGLDKNAYRDFLNQLEDSAKTIPDNVQEISFSLYISPQNTAVGQSCEISLKNNNSGPRKVSLNYATENNGKVSSKALTLSEDSKVYFYATQKADSAQSGEVILAVQDASSGQHVGLQISYSDFKKDQFMGMPVYLGKYTVSLQDPKNSLQNSLLQNVYDSDTQELLKNLTHSSVTVTNSLTGEKMSTSIDFSLSGLGDLKVTQTTSGLSSEKITLPDVQSSQAISVTKDGIGNSDYDRMTQYQKSSLTYLSKLMKSHSGLSDILSQIGLSQDDINSQLQYY